MPYYPALTANIVGEFLPMVVLVSIVFIQPASAYVDPSTGSYMLQLGMGFLFGALFSIKAFFRRFSSRRNERKD
ncbi:MAG: hypothetical protein IT342_10875 [Candidatus Melainabacteria bacterium]|nr:hypothetical protein [Candidatus Melainabacteria bacterium]